MSNHSDPDRTTSEDAMTEESVLLKTRDLTKSFGSLVAVDGVTLEFYENEVVGIIGPNGAGKTTFINLIAGRLMPSDGQIHFQETEITNLAEYKRVKHGIARSFQIPEVYGDLTALENVRASIISREKKNNHFFRPLSRDPETREEAGEYLSMFGLEDQAEIVADALPHGDRKILDIAMTFALEPEIILLDEPTSGIGSESTGPVMETTINVAKATNTSLIFIEHDMDLITRYSDRVVGIHNGSVLEEGTPEDVLESETVKEHIREEGV